MKLRKEHDSEDSGDNCSSWSTDHSGTSDWRFHGRLILKVEACSQVSFFIERGADYEDQEADGNDEYDILPGKED